ncbi:carboxylic ester hydrolase [Actinoallomurus iriomotensis]|uniref:Carboxylic ester hydrolase n=2 Tax=Actinoallomurus iriomotensis TaxID=478107 RepID=A0A9W6SEY1_9ACTN|nr:carboxylic ester hydrolase [Actinoallomurus iriomotensis]
MFKTWADWRRRTWLVAAGVILGALLAATPALSASVPSRPAATGEPVARTANGMVRGLAKGAVDEFLGIPYAAPPVGALRWRPPHPTASWPGVRDAARFASDCAQSAGPFGQASSSEDCLYLNVYTPSHRQAASRSPVMVWIHGGGLHSGAGDIYDPTALVEDGVTVVTINYRLGALGFLAHPALADAHGQSGDYGLIDQQAALRWVQRNISGFGADPHNVTIFGESAGGLSVLAQLASPQARGLFQRAIVESGSYNLTQSTVAAAEASGKAFAVKAGCVDQTAACLRHLPVSTILADQAGQYLPNINTDLLPQSLETAFATGHFNRVPIINGTNHDEWRLFVASSELAGQRVTAANYQAMISSTLGVPAAQASDIAAKYPLTAYASPSLALSAVGTDAVFACPALTIDQSASRSVPTFAYEFNDQNAPENFFPPVSFPYGAPHASELQYLLDLPKAPFPGALSARQQQLAAVMKTYWTNVAERGLPTSPGTPFWPPFDSRTQQLQSLIPPTPHVETGFANSHKCPFWAALQGGAA